jgi:aryl sulfotransferase
VHRDLRDVTISWANHRREMRAELIEVFNELAADDDVAPLAPVWDGDLDTLIDELVAEFDIARHLDSWWGLRGRPNVLFVHFNDLLADLDGEMRRISAFLDQPVPEQRWPAVVERCTIEEMREQGRQSERIGLAFENGVDSFFHRGTNRRWEGVLTDAQLQRLAGMTAVLPPDAAAWLEHGSLALGWRP